MMPPCRAPRARPCAVLARVLCPLLAALPLLVVAPAARACVIISAFVVDAGGAETPIVCENIWWNGGFGANALFDYQFFVGSGGPGAIDLFGFGTGGFQPLAAAVPNASTAGPTAGANAGALVGAGLVVTGQSNRIFGANAPPAGWAFDEYLQPAGANYFVNWNDQGNGVKVGNAAFNVNNNPGSIAFNGTSFGVFNAFSPYGPVPGFGVVDPPGAGYFDVEFTDSGALTGNQIMGLVQGVSQVGPTGLCSSYSGPCTDPNGNPLISPVPEPASGGVLAAALAGLAGLASRRRRG